MRLVCGLGNPGLDYAKTRHNVGFMAADDLVRRFSFSAGKEKFKSVYHEGKIDGVKTIIIKPQTFMNLSGVSVRAFSEFYKIPAENILILQDELDLPFGTVRLKHGGGLAGHNGLKSIEAHLGTNAFARIRIGIDKSDVLGKFSKEQLLTLEETLLPEVSQKVETWMKEII